MKTYCVIGGAGFIGSHLADALAKQESNARIRIYDNFSSGRMWHLENIKYKNNVEIIKADVTDLNTLIEATRGVDTIYHFAANPDIAKAATQPDIDFWQGTYLTNNVLDAMRVNRVKKILYASGSGIYGDTGLHITDENHSPCLPISTYGASKLACEAMICSYCYMFDFTACAFRFANVVGPRQTHGVGYDFVRSLIKKPTQLTILGDGTQDKSYIYVNDIVAALRLMEKIKTPEIFSSFNVSTNDSITVRKIAKIVAKVMELQNVHYSFTGGKKGWKGDVPVIRLNSQKLRAMNWQNQYNCSEAILKSVTNIYKDALAGRFDKEKTEVQT